MLEAIMNVNVERKENNGNKKKCIMKICKCRRKRKEKMRLGFFSFFSKSFFSFLYFSDKGKMKVNDMIQKKKNIINGTR